MRRVTQTNLERTAQLLTSRHGITVVFEAGVAKTQGRVITLPTVPDTASPVLVNALQGYLDQQVGQILFGDTECVTGQTSSLVSVYKALEDVRVEQRMETLYPGCVINFENLRQWVDVPAFSSPLEQILLSLWLLLRNPHDPRRSGLVELHPVVQVLEHLFLLRKPSTSDENLSLALEMLEILQHEVPLFTDLEVAEQGQAEEAGPIAQNLVQEAQHSVESETGSSSSRAYEHGLSGTGYTVFSTAGDVVERVPMPDDPTAYAYLAALRRRSRPQVSVLKRKLVNVLRATTRKRWVGGQSSGKVDPRRLYKAVVSSSTEIYKTLRPKVDLNTAVFILIDQSHSMTGRPLELAVESVLVLGDVLNALKIPFMVTGHSTGGVPLTVPPESSQNLYARWSNLWLGHYKVFGEPWRTGSLKLTQARYNNRSNTLDGEAVLYGIRTLLSRPEKRRILLVMNDGQPYPGFGDVARCQQYLKDVVAAGSAAGVEIVAFGIQSSAVEEYYPHHVVVEDLSSLVGEPLRLLTRILLGKNIYA